MGRIVDAISPPRLGPRFRLLVGATWASNLGDGFALAAGPLLVASQTDDPVLVATAVFLQRLPWLLFGLFAGVVADRVDRRLVVVVADASRAVVLVMLALAITGDVLRIWMVLAVMFVLGTAEAFSDVTSGALLPMLVEPGDLGVGNSRLVFGHITANQLIGPPIGAALFALGMAWPAVGQAVLLVFGTMLIWRLSGTTPPPQPEGEPMRRQIVDAVRWMWHHAPVRTLALTIITFNVTFGAAWSVLVLYATERLGLGPVGFGLLTTMSAAGGIVGSWAYPAIERRVHLGVLMRAGLVIETLTHVALAVTTTPAVAMLVFVAFGVHTAVWATTSTSIRQRAVPTELQGRVGAAYMIGLQGGLLVGTAIGGVIAGKWGVTAPFWFAFVGSVVILVCIWGSLIDIAHDDEERMVSGSA